MTRSKGICLSLCAVLALLLATACATGQQATTEKAELDAFCAGYNEATLDGALHGATASEKQEAIAAQMTAVFETRGLTGEAFMGTLATKTAVDQMAFVQSLATRHGLEEQCEGVHGLFGAPG